MSSLIKKLTIAASLGLILHQAATATLIDDFEAKNNPDKFVTESHELKEPVNLNFHETSLSHVLLLLAKIANINIIFPHDLDRKISIQLKDREVFDAMRDILEINKLKYVFERNTLSIAPRELNDSSQEIVELAFSDSKDMADTLNQGLFAQLISSQSATASKPLAFSYPNKNLVIISGNIEQLAAAKRLIKKLDVRPSIDYYTLEKIDANLAVQILQQHFPNKEVTYKIEEGKTVFIRGNKNEVTQALALLKDNDQIQGIEADS